MTQSRPTPPLAPESETLLIDMQPIGRRITITAGTNLLAAAQEAGVELVSLCGGDGWCESCKIQRVTGELSSPTTEEREFLSDDDIADGYRLACQSIPLSDVKIHIPSNSLTTPQRLQLEAEELELDIAPMIVDVDIEVKPPVLEYEEVDVRGDDIRVKSALEEKGFPSVTMSLAIQKELSERMREYKWHACVALRQDEIIAVLPCKSQLLGLAVDIGSTKVAAYLLDLKTGKTIAQLGEMNPQIAYGEDVLSRLAYIRENEDSQSLLQDKLIEKLNEMIVTMCKEIKMPTDCIVDAVMVGNTAIHHLLTGLPIEQLAAAPYVPSVGASMDIPARELGINLAAGAYIHLLPNIAGFVGADHVSMVFASRIGETNKTVIGVDVGTNTEITLTLGGRLFSCSCPSGPAFEGAHIKHGMRAAEGAIERIKIIDGKIHTFTVGDTRPIGICGSGILDAVAEMRNADIIDDTGALQVDHDLVQKGEEGSLPKFVLVPAAQTGNDCDITMTRKDVNEIQLAKAAIRSGIDILLATAGIDKDDLDEFIVAGAFGSYINIPSAIRIGLFPDIPTERFRQVGNAAGLGARQTLISKEARKSAAQMAERIEYVELTTYMDFQTLYLKSMYL